MEFASLSTPEALALKQLGWDRKPTPAEALELFCTPARIPMARIERLAADTAGPFSMMEGDDRICGWAWGEGPTIALVHGWSGRGMQLSGFVEPLVEAGFKVVTWDHPAHGDSEGSFCTAIRVAALLEEVTRRFGPLHGMVAHSFGAVGATYAMGLGVASPKVAYLAPSAWIPERFLAFGAGVGLNEPEMDEYMRLSRERFHPIDLELASPARIAPRLNETQAWIAHDPADIELPFENGRSLAHAWPGSTFVEAHGLGHRRIIRDRKVIAQVVAFLAC